MNLISFTYILLHLIYKIYCVRNVGRPLFVLHKFEYESFSDCIQYEKCLLAYDHEILFRCLRKQSYDILNISDHNLSRITEYTLGLYSYQGI